MIENIIKDAIKNKKILFGYKKSLRYLKLNSPKVIVIAKNVPEKIKRHIEQNAKIDKVKIETFNGTSKDLGAFCGKPFPISVLIIKE